MVIQVNVDDKTMNGTTNNLTVDENLVFNNSVGFQNYSSVWSVENSTLFSRIFNVTIQSPTMVTRRPSTPDIVMYRGSDDDGLPVPLLIASPVAAVSIFIFVCLAYYWHAAQLDARARELAMKLSSGDLGIELPIKKSLTTSSILSSTDSDLLLYQQHNNKRRGTMRSSATLSPPPMGPRSSRGSLNWSAIADKELVTYSAPRRHSTFII